MQASSRAIPVTDYIDAVRPVDVVVSPWPCKSCEYATFCRDNVSQCSAWRQYDSVGHKGGKWNPEDRVPDRLGISMITQRHFPCEGAVIHNGWEFKAGSMSELIYLIIKKLQVASNADIAKALDERSVDCAKSSLKSITRRMVSRGQLIRLPSVGFSWGPEAKL